MTAADADVGELRIDGDVELSGKQRVVPDLGMGVEREVVGGERDLGVEERLEPAADPRVDHARLVVPEDAVVDDDELRARLGGELEQLERGRDRADDLGDLVGAFDLHSLRPVVGPVAEVEELGREGEDLVASATGGTLPCVGLGVWRSLVARSVRVGEAPSSNLGTPITARGKAGRDESPFSRPPPCLTREARGQNPWFPRGPPPRARASEAVAPGAGDWAGDFSVLAPLILTSRCRHVGSGGEWGFILSLLSAFSQAMGLASVHARGEIPRDEYLQARDDLRGTPEAPTQVIPPNPEPEAA